MYQETPEKLVRLKPWVTKVAKGFLFGLAALALCYLIWRFVVTPYKVIGYYEEIVANYEANAKAYEQRAQLQKEYIVILETRVQQLEGETSLKDSVINKLSNRKVISLPSGSVLKVESSK